MIIKVIYLAYLHHKHNIHDQKIGVLSKGCNLNIGIFNIHSTTF